MAVSSWSRILLLALAAAAASAEEVKEGLMMSEDIVNFGSDRVAGSNRVVGGTFATLGQFPYQAALQAVPDGQVSGFCSATVVDSTTVVTNGNCCYNLQDAFDLSDIYVLAGDTNLFGSTLASSQRVPVVRMTTHRYFTPGVSGSRGNICVVNLDPSNPLDLSTDFVGGVPPNDGSLDLDAVTSICYLAGWGSTNPTDPDQEFTAELVYRQVLPQDDFACDIVFPDGEYDPADMLCYSAGPCRGDLGGGLVCNGRLVGVFNGVEDTLCNLPGYYTDVQLYEAFINSGGEDNGDGTGDGNGNGNGNGNGDDDDDDDDEDGASSIAGAKWGLAAIFAILSRL